MKDNERIIPRMGLIPPYGYKKIEGDDKHWEAVPLELEALEKAREYCKTCSYREVARWLTQVTGRSISGAGLYQRLQREYKRKARESGSRGGTATQEKFRQAKEAYS